MTQKIDINKKYRTKDGNEVVLYTTDGRNKSFPVVGEVVFATGSTTLNCWTSCGKGNATYSQTMNLVEVKPRIKRTVWLNIGDDLYDTCAYNGKQDADFCASIHRKACVKVEIDCEEGEGL